MATRPISKIAMLVACQHGAMFAEPDAAIPQHWQVTDIATVLIRRGECIDIDTVPDVGYECSTHAQHQPSMKSGCDIFCFFLGGGLPQTMAGEQATLLCCG
jgi:hypothetical protein